MCALHGRLDDIRFAVNKFETRNALEAYLNDSVGAIFYLGTGQSSYAYFRLLKVGVKDALFTLSAEQVQLTDIFEKLQITFSGELTSAFDLQNRVQSENIKGRRDNEEHPDEEPTEEHPEDEPNAIRLEYKNLKAVLSYEINPEFHGDFTIFGENGISFFVEVSFTPNANVVFTATDSLLPDFDPEKLEKTWPFEGKLGVIVF